MSLYVTSLKVSIRGSCMRVTCTQSLSSLTGPSHMRVTLTQRLSASSLSCECRLGSLSLPCLVALLCDARELTSQSLPRIIVAPCLSETCVERRPASLPAKESQTIVSLLRGFHQKRVSSLPCLRKRVSDYRLSLCCHSVVNARVLPEPQEKDERDLACWLRSSVTLSLVRL